MKEVFNQQTNRQKEETGRLRVTLAESEAKCKALEAERNQDGAFEEMQSNVVHSEILELIKQQLNVDEDKIVVEKIIEIKETATLLENELKLAHETI